MQQRCSGVSHWWDWDTQAWSSSNSSIEKHMKDSPQLPFIAELLQNKTTDYLYLPMLVWLNMGPASLPV